MKIFKSKEPIVYVWDLNRWFTEKNISEGTKFGISWKIGKKRKLRSYTITYHRFWETETWGDDIEITLKKGDDTFKMDNSWGINQISFQ
jgi:hypothetical protein